MVNSAKLDKYLPEKWLATLGMGFFGAILCYAFQNSSTALIMLVDNGIRFDATQPGQWEAVINHLPPGGYFISAGRPRGLCDLLIDGKIVDSTKAPISGLKQSFLLGAGFQIATATERHTSKIACAEEGGFSPGLTHVPVVVPFKLGIVLQGWRALTDFTIGPILSLILLCLLIFSRSKMNSTNRLLDLRHWGFAITTVFYSASLAHLPRLFMPGLEASVLHACLRATFAFALFMIATEQRQPQWTGTIVYLAVLATYIMGYHSRPEGFEELYTVSLPIFDLLTVYALWNSFRVERLTRMSCLLRIVLATWIFAQLDDLVVLQLNFGAHLAPSIVTLTLIAIISHKRFENAFERSVPMINAEILRIVSSAAPVDFKLREIGQALQHYTPFLRTSIYADAYVLGIHDRPFERLIRIQENGYTKDTSIDREIGFDGERGMFMKAAMAGGVPKLYSSKANNAWFCSVPVGKHAVVNLSDPVERSAVRATESFELIERASPALHVLHSELTEFAARMGYQLERLRLLRGDGSWTEEIGCIFLDINNFDDNIETYGESYGRFVSQVYLPALCKSVQRWAVREGNSAGDSVYLICVADLLLERCSIPDAVERTLAGILVFADAAGADMCKARGFPIVKLQIGANAGLATIICDSFQVRTSGRVVNQSARLQQAGQPGTVLIHADLAERLSPQGLLQIGPMQEDVKKTRRLVSHKVTLRKRAVA